MRGGLGYRVSARWWFTLNGDVGVASIGSDLAWQAYANVGFRASRLISIIAGYRVIAMDYEDGSGREYFAYDVTMSGPQVGVGFHF